MTLYFHLLFSIFKSINALLTCFRIAIFMDWNRGVNMDYREKWDDDECIS